jgi:diguanylate cyclase (GGDEF)-like protein
VDTLWDEWARSGPTAVFLALGDDTRRAALCREAARRFPDSGAPILVAMRNLSEALIQSAYSAGAADVVGVPVRWSTALPRLERLLAGDVVHTRAPDPVAVVLPEVLPEVGSKEEELRSQLETSWIALQSLQRIAGLGTWSYDFGNGGMEWSDQTYEILGLPGSELANFDALSMTLHPRDRERVVEAFQSTSIGGEPLRLNCRVVLPSGGVRHVQVRGEQPLDGTSLMRGTLQDVTEQQRAQEKIRQLAHFDGLTGLANRRRFMEQLKKASQRQGAEDRKMALLYLDLDQFKRVNDTLGHSAGDELLQAVAQILFEKVRVSDVIGRPSTTEDAEISRLGGDEFAILLGEINERDDAQLVAERILAALPKPITVDGHEISTTGSIGIAIHPDDGEDVETLLKHADRALYHAKESGRNSFKFFSESLNFGAMKRLRMESRLRNAIENGGLRFHYQPRFELDEQRVVAIEALMRWNDSELGQVSPKDFIGVAEDTGLILPLGLWGLREACNQVRAWQAEGLSAVPVSVNVSTAQFRRADFIKEVGQVLASTGLDPSLLELEVTESLMLQDDEGTATQLRELRAMGIRIALDDFGTGYSSLSYLARYPLDLLKLDRSLVRDLSSDHHAQGIATAVISMSHVLGLRVVGEGVDQQGNLDFLKEQGCDEVQGFLLAEALEPAEMGRLLAAQPGPASPDPAEDAGASLLAFRRPS